MSPLAQKIAEIIDDSINNDTGMSSWRGKILDQEWKISAVYDKIERDIIKVVVKRRDQI